MTVKQEHDESVPGNAVSMDKQFLVLVGKGVATHVDG